MIEEQYKIILVDRANKNVVETTGNTSKVIQYLNSNRYKVLSIYLEDKRGDK